MNNRIPPGPGSAGFRRPKKVTLRQATELNEQLGKKLRAMLDENIKLKNKLTGYTKVFVHMLGGEARIPLHSFEKELKDFELVAEPPEEGGPQEFVYRLVPVEEEKEESGE